MQYIIAVLTKRNIYPQTKSQGHSHTIPWLNNHVLKDQ